ncbi:hypothetical protein K0B96_05325 [Horticoccus luteus]|uniref:DUF6249 domain-containing protein n=1 Tax=Horticoccus luteus TaxID=2862869 RepID=A0A8F9TYU5_9BACT|nr:DUF6249 domain-containing protein [Horticoccus luteus]QYM80042.1 hypothetical protein K0B96_05325 [Horticoccus luteus]
MQLHLASYFANVTSISPFWIPISAISGGVLIVFLSMYFAHERRRLWHDTARVALEKGQPLPPALQQADDRSRRRCGPRNDLRSGLILLAVSFGLYYGLRDVGSGPQLIGAYITGGIGVALLLNGLLTALFRRNNPSTDLDRPPQS